MPHIAIQASPELLAAIPWERVLHQLHAEMGEQGHARLHDMKSRVQPIAAGLCGLDGAALQLVATLTLTNPRTPEVISLMSGRVLARLSEAIDAHAPRAWIQCCVFVQELPRQHYLKEQWNPPTPLPEPT